MSFPTLARWRTSLCQLPRFSTGPGEVSLAGTIANSDGTGGHGMRVFGQWALVYVVAGTCVYRDERGTVEEVGPGSWIMVFPEMAHAYRSRPGERWDEIYVCFRGPVFEAWRQAGCFDPSKPTGRWLPPAKGVKAFENFFRQIQRKDCSALQAACLWQNLLAEIVGEPRESAVNREDWLRKALDFLEHSEPGADADTLRQAASTCGMGYESFRKKFGSAVGMPPGRYLLTRRVERARRLLTLESFTNEEIAQMLGFHDEFHFSKTFSRLTGASPREFRKQVRVG